MSLESVIDEKDLWDELSESTQKKAEKYLNPCQLGRGGKLKVTINEEAYAQVRKDYGYSAPCLQQSGGLLRDSKKVPAAQKD